MTAMRFLLTGAPEIAARLVEIQERTRGQFLENCVLAGAMPVVNEAKTNLNTIPSLSLRRGGEPITETGNLARSVHASGGEGLEEPTTGTDIGGLKSNATSAECLVGTNVAYAARVEYGFVGVDDRGRKYHQPANPWLRPAFVTAKDDVKRDMREAARDQLKAMVRT